MKERKLENKGNKKEPIFVIQKHDASNLHYDFRLEISGVLKSWALPKKPSLNPKEKRLAIPTEDHSLQYADFEGNIPSGQYGAGQVVIWDKGSFQNLRKIDIKKSFQEGKIKINIKGKKIKGAFSLIKMDNNWLLIKEKENKES
jgi:DNA ligase D-like protein (predicted 3'-phosphoesterase)